MDTPADPTPDQLASLIRSHALFADLGDAAVAALVAAGRTRSFAAGDILLRQGDESDSALLLFEGAVGVVAETEFGSVTLSELSGVCLLGDVGIYARLPRSATLIARVPSRALVIGRDAMLEVCYRDPAVPLRVIQQLGARLNSFNQAIATYADALSALDAESGDSRIIDALLAPPPELTNFAGAFRRMALFIGEQRRQREEMASAAAIQNALLPFPLPSDGQNRFRLDAVIKPARHVGGDFFDCFALGPDAVVVTMGDVSGKGVPASLFATVCQMVMRLVLREGTALGEALAKANALIASANREGMFATFFVARLDLASGDLRFCNAGHVWPVIQRADGACDFLRGRDLPLAVLDDAAYGEERDALRPGDRLVLCTDGVTEAVNPDNEEFEQERLLARLGELRGERDRLAARIVEAVEAFSDGADQFDDIACLVLSYDGAAAA